MLQFMRKRQEYVNFTVEFQDELGFDSQERDVRGKRGAYIDTGWADGSNR